MSCGAELNGATKEVFTLTGGVTIATAAARSGTYGFRTTDAAGSLDWPYRSVRTAEDIYYRLYFRLNTLTILSGTPPVTAICFPSSLNAAASSALIGLTSAGEVGLYGGDLTLYGSLTTLTIGQWYRLELRINSTTVGSTTWTLLVDGVQTGTRTGVVGTTGYNDLLVGNQATWTNMTLQADFDDLAINDTAGTKQNSYPGDGKIVHLFVNGDGDTTNRGIQATDWDTGPTAGQGAALQVDEKPTPDDATSYVVLIVASTGSTNRVPYFALEDGSVPGIGATDTITLVQVGIRVTGLSSTACSWVIGLKSQSAGTIVESGTISQASASWFTNDDTVPSNYQLTSYTDPQAGGAWTRALLDTAQIGVRAPDATPDVFVSHMWAVVEYVPAVVASIPNRVLNIRQAVNRAGTY